MLAGRTAYTLVMKINKRTSQQYGVHGRSIGVALFALLFLTVVGCSSQGGITIGEQRATAEAVQTQAAAAAGENAVQISADLEQYCNTNPDRCIVEGNPDSEYVVYEFSDYGCPACRSFVEVRYPAIKSQYIDTGVIKFVVIPAPILGGVTPNTPASANAALCAIEQGAGHEIHEALFTIQVSGNDPAEDALLEIGRGLGLGATYASCVENGSLSNEASENRVIAINAGISSTPTLLFNGLQIQSSPDAIGAAIAAVE